MTAVLRSGGRCAGRKPSACNDWEFPSLLPAIADAGNETDGVPSLFLARKNLTV